MITTEKKKGKLKYFSLIQDDETRFQVSQIIKESSNSYIAAEVFDKVFEEGFRHKK